MRTTLCSILPNGTLHYNEANHIKQGTIDSQYVVQLGSYIMVRMSVFSCIPYLCQIDKDVPTRMFKLFAGVTFTAMCPVLAVM